MTKKKASKAAKPKPRNEVLITLRSQSSIGQAIELRQELLAGLEGASSVSIDAGAVEEIDTAILQLLASLWRTGRERGIDCSFSNASPAFRHRALLIGVAEALNIAEPG